MRRSTLASFILASAAWMASSDLVAPVARAQDAAPAATRGAVPVDVGASDVPQLIATLNDPATKQDVRDQAARRLVVRPSAEARDAIRAAVSNSQQPSVQVAALRALADQTQGDPALITPLFALMDPNGYKTTIDAAAHALTVYKNNPDVVSRMINLAKNAPDDRLRQASIRALGTFADKNAAQALLDLLDPNAQPPSINACAADALNYMTGLSYGPDTDPWRKWFDGQKEKSDIDFRVDILSARAVRYDIASQGTTELSAELVRLLGDQYQSTPREGRVDLLMRRLKSPSPMLRQVGAQVVASSALTDPTPQIIKEQLRSLIGDSSPDVRKQVAEALAVINDLDALSPLLTQLAQEKDSGVRAAIADALRPIADVRSVPLLLKLLDDPSIDTADASATALSYKGLGEKIIATDPTQARQTAEKITEVLTRRTGPQSNTDLREHLIRGLAELHQHSSMSLLVRMLGSASETPKVKRAVLDALGSLKDPEVAATIAEMLDDPDPTIRVKVLQVLALTSNSFDYGPRVQKLLDDTNPAVRDAAWETFKVLVTKATDQQLPLIADRFPNDPARRIVVLTEMVARARTRNDQNEIAIRLQQLGDASMADKHPEVAVTYYQDALKIREQGKQPTEIRYVDYLSEQLIVAFLQSRHFQDAIDFAGEKIKQDQQFQGVLGPKICGEAERLFQTSDYESTSKLVDAALKMSPALKEQFTQRLERLRTELIARQNQHNVAPPAPSLQLAGTL